MSVNYLLADFATRIRNALMVGKLQVTLPHSKLLLGVASVLKEDGWIAAFSVVSNSNTHKVIELDLKYDENGDSVIRDIKLISKPSKREYVPKGKIPKVQSGFGSCVLSTSLGVLSGRNARLKGVGGELLLEVA